MCIICQMVWLCPSSSMKLSAELTYASSEGEVSRMVAVLRSGTCHIDAGDEVSLTDKYYLIHYLVFIFFEFVYIL